MDLRIFYFDVSRSPPGQKKVLEERPCGILYNMPLLGVVVLIGTLILFGWIRASSTSACFGLKAVELTTHCDVLLCYEYGFLASNETMGLFLT